jgi:hypothetical protein
MIYIDVTKSNEFALNINNNQRGWPNNYAGSPPVQQDTGNVQFRFTHILSNHFTFYSPVICYPLTYQDPIPPSSARFYGRYNDRYVDFEWQQAYIGDKLIYDGEYLVEVNEAGTTLYEGIWKVTGNSSVESDPFVEYQSDNEGNDNYIYIEE